MKSALSRLYSNDGNPNICNLSLYDICDILFTNFVALCCTFSIAILSFFYTGGHTEAAYSRCGLTSALYSLRIFPYPEK